MRFQRSALALVATAAVALSAALPATGKDGVKATLKRSMPLDAPAGTRLDVAWTLAYVDERGKRQKFGAGGLFVRLLSASGAPPVTAFAREDHGIYRASAVVPEGGIGDVEFGLAGWQSGANGTRRADAIFPIANDPLPKGVRAAAPVARASEVLILVGGALVALAVLGLRGRPGPRSRFG
jgi:hypothetical protein